MRILIDMDEVLADFTGAALRLHGWTRERLEDVRMPGTWDLTEIMSISQDEFWKPINAMEEAFWTAIDPLPWFDDLLDAVESILKIGDEWYVVSSPSSEPGCYSGKAKWLKDRIGCDFDRFILTKYKMLLAQPRVLLIDDNMKNVQQFTSTGGSGLVFPSYGNFLYSFAEYPVEYLIPLLKQFKERSDAFQIS